MGKIWLDQFTCVDAEKFRAEWDKLLTIPANFLSPIRPQEFSISCSVAPKSETESNKMNPQRSEPAGRAERVVTADGIYPERRRGGKWQDREAKRAEAEERNAAWRGLTPLQKLAALDKRPGKSERQRKRIRAELAATVKPEPVAKADKAPKLKSMPDEFPRKKS